MSDDLDLSAVHQRHEPDPEFRAALRRRVAQIVSPDGSARPDPEGSVVEVIELDLGLRRTPRRRLRSVLLVAVAAAAAVIAIAVVTIPSDESTVPSDESTVSSSVPAPGGGPAFAAAIEASGVLNSPSADEVEQAMNHVRYAPATGETQVSAAGNYVSLRTSCLSDAAFGAEPSSTCAWAYTAGAADGVEVHGGLLGEANGLEVFVLDGRYFVAVESAPDAQAPPTAWLIDAVSGMAGPLRWRDTPTTLRSPEQALLVCDESHPYSRQCFLPRVVDARDGTIQPLAVPDDAASDLPVAQHGTGRIWVGTALDGDPAGLAYSDDGGGTWTEVALPVQAYDFSEEVADASAAPEIAADGDRVALTSGEGPLGGGDTVSVSDDAGQSWTIAAPPEPEGNRAHLFVLADGRLTLLWSIDAHPHQLLVSTGTDWAALEEVDAPWEHPFVERTTFGVNRAGIAWSHSVSSARAFEVTFDYSTDLTNWRTIEGLEGLDD